MKKYKDFNVGVKQSIVIVLIAIIGSVSGYFLNRMYTKQVQYGNLLAVTERQAMILKLLSASMPPNANLTNQSTQQIQNSSFLFQSAQVALLHGGKVANTIYVLPQADAEDKKANKLLRTIDKLWSQYKQESQKSASTKSDEQQANIQDILSNLEKQTWALNTHFQELTTKHNQWMNMAMALLAIIILAMIGVVYLLLEKFLKTPIRQIAEVSVRAASGDLSHTVAYHADDELGKIAQSLNRVTQNQLQLSDFAEKIGEGDFTIQYTQLGEGDKLGQGH